MTISRAEEHLDKLKRAARIALQDAPHGKHCPAVTLRMGGQCSCWKFRLNDTLAEIETSFSREELAEVEAALDAVKGVPPLSEEQIARMVRKATNARWCDGCGDMRPRDPEADDWAIASTIGIRECLSWAFCPVCVSTRVSVVGVLSGVREEEAARSSYQPPDTRIGPTYAPVLRCHRCQNP